MDASQNHTPRLGERKLFPRLQARAYLAHAAVSPPSSAVEAAVARFVADQASTGVSAFMTYKRRRDAFRPALAALIGARADDIALMGNTTQGVSAIAVSLPWRAGDRVVLCRGEFPTNVTPWLQAARAHDLVPVWLDAPDPLRPVGDFLDRLAAALEGGARLVALSAVAFQTGMRLPLGAIAALCHQHGAELFVDAIQAVGALPIDVVRDRVDYLAAGSHKWMMGLDGAGLLYIAPERVGALRPLLAGWLSHEDGLGFLGLGAGHLRYDRPIRQRADIFESGMSNAAGFAALEAGVSPLAELGTAAIFEHVDRYNGALDQGLRGRGFRSLRASTPDARSGILSVFPPEGVDLIALHAALDARGIVTSTPDGLLRFAPHWPNAHAEVPQVLDAVDEAVKTLRRG
ncbi:MAG: aminotransferase class V-fold PLP-dependent enzyme [Myxococcota bacterium]